MKESEANSIWAPVEFKIQKKEQSRFFIFIIVGVWCNRRAQGHVQNHTVNSAPLVKQQSNSRNLERSAACHGSLLVEIEGRKKGKTGFPSANGQREREVKSEEAEIDTWPCCENGFTQLSYCVFYFLFNVLSHIFLFFSPQVCSLKCWRSLIHIFPLHPRIHLGAASGDWLIH